MRILASAQYPVASDPAATTVHSAPPATAVRPGSEFILSAPAIIRREPVAVDGEAPVETLERR